jgi:hypothetical protein
VYRQRTELATEPDQVVRADRLVAKDDDAVLDEGPADRGKLLVFQGFAQIDLTDLGPEIDADLCDPDTGVFVGDSIGIDELQRRGL